MAVFNGTLLGVYITDGAPPTTKMIAAAQDVSLSLNMETIDVTTKQSGGFRDLLAGNRSGSISVNGLIDYSVDADEKNVSELFTAYNNRTELDLRFQKDEDNDVAGDLQWFAKGRLTSLEQSAGTEDTATYSATFELSDLIQTVAIT